MERLQAPFAFGSSALLSLRFFISFFFACLRRENSPLFALREMCCAMRMSVFYLMRCEDTNGRMRLFLYRCERILCGYYGRFLVWWCFAHTDDETTDARFWS
ncbi:unknown protein [Bathycoccus prasinos]|uniref:Uncharacterized protein n=1 Tax=Bathycoccus prasinos TaxID=41875 RepID=K8EYP8_9CHLO|nr:unknown protein [Bathycoccus prasinos]CCO17625.1 unknown protein [Bathycoccus prasinos]|eukprot:XP_007511504.1 unknown protein [Bathycoccus prasinos]